MKTRNLIILLCLSVFALSSCETTERIDDFPLRPAQLVVNCAFTEGIPFSFQVSKSLSVLDNADLKLVDSATVKLYKGDLLIETISEKNEMGWFSSESSIPEAGQKYSIQVTSPDFENTLLSEETTPQKIPVNDVTLQIKDSSFWEYEDYQGFVQYRGNIEGSFDIVFADPAGAENFYALSIFYLDTVFREQDNRVEYSLNKRTLGITSENSAIENAGDNYSVLMFRDELFDGQDYKINVEFNDWQAWKGKIYYVELITYNRAGYLYKKSIDDYYSAINDPFAEPVQIFGNIENGYGIFMGQSVSYKIITLLP